MNPDAVRVIRRSDPTPAGFVRVYVGRPSPLGNPFPISPTSIRAQVIERFRAHATAALASPDHPLTRALAALRARLDAGERLALECYCAPLPCHANLLADLLCNPPAPARDTTTAPV